RSHCDRDRMRLVTRCRPRLVRSLKRLPENTARPDLPPGATLPTTPNLIAIPVRAWSTPDRWTPEKRGPARPAASGWGSDRTTAHPRKRRGRPSGGGRHRGRVAAMSERPANKPWDQRPDEPDPAFVRFLIYRDLGPGRSLIQAYLAFLRLLDGSTEGVERRSIPGQWYRDSRQWEWVRRARAWDVEVFR